jgi:aerobic-type carbon monoxide dehydrogenase small subunit (CoxS/CutS family)
MFVTEPGGTTSDPVAEPDTSQEKPALSVTRRNFLIGAGAGAAAAGVVLGGAVVANKAINPEATTTTTTTTGVGPVPATMRRVTLNIDNVKYDLIVDNRESLWETMNFQLGLSNSNLGCDRAQCGACAVLVDGKAVNGCTVLSARLGRGQVIGTVAGLPKGPGVSGLHPVQRAFWLDGGFQCGICTRGFIMSTVQLLGANPKPNTTQIAEALSGNICRCGEYAKIFTSVNVAAAELRGEQVTHLASPIVVNATGVKDASPTAVGTSKEFQFAVPMGTIEDFEPFEQALKKRDGILAVSGSERAVTVKWDPAKLDEAKVRDILKDLGHAVR